MFFPCDIYIILSNTMLYYMHNAYNVPKPTFKRNVVMFTSAVLNLRSAHTRKLLSYYLNKKYLVYVFIYL